MTIEFNDSLFIKMIFVNDVRFILQFSSVVWCHNADRQIKRNEKVHAKHKISKMTKQF